MMECYVKVGNDNYLIPNEVVLITDRIISKYLIHMDDRDYLDIDKIIDNNGFQDIFDIYKTLKYYTETYAMNMSAIGMCSKVDKDFDPLKTFMNMKIKLNESEKLINDNTNTDMDMKYGLVVNGLIEMLKLNELMIRNDEFVDSKVR